MKTIYTTFLMLGLSQAVLAMPCDAGYKCISKSGKYEILLGSCRDSNSLKLQGISIAKKEVKATTLGPAYDGAHILAFEVPLPTQAEDLRKLTVEISRKGHPGTVREEIQESNPGPLKTIASEQITCELKD